MNGVDTTRTQCEIAFTQVLDKLQAMTTYILATSLTISLQVNSFIWGGEMEYTEKDTYYTLGRFPTNVLS